MGFLDASTLSNIGLATQAAGVVTSAMGASNNAKAEKYALDYQAKVAANNAQIARWQASDAITRGQAEAGRQQLKTRQLKGTQRAMMAARGVDLGEGSALNILSDTDFMGALDANQITDNAAKEAWSYQQEANNASSNSEVLRGRAKGVSPGSAAFSTLLSGAGGVMSSWYSMKKKTEAEAENKRYG